MRAINIADLEPGLSLSIRSLREGEEIVVSDREVPVARILPFRREVDGDGELRLVLSGDLKLPEEEMDWQAFFALPAGVAWNDAVQAALESRGDW